MPVELVQEVLDEAEVWSGARSLEDLLAMKRGSVEEFSRSVDHEIRYRSKIDQARLSS